MSVEAITRLKIISVLFLTMAVFTFAAIAAGSDPINSPAIVSETPIDFDKGEYSVQVYSFQDEERAKTAVANLRSKGYPARVLMSDLGDKGVWHRVRVGSYDEVQARSILKKIKEDFDSGIIVKNK